MINLYQLINEAEFKLEILPQEYFVEYFEKEFLPKLKDFYKMQGLLNETKRITNTKIY